MTTFVQALGIIPTDREKETLIALQKTGMPSMKVVGRGTLTMSVEDAKKSENYKRISAKISEFVR